MPNPTLEDDISALRSYIGAEEGDGRPWAHDAVAALDRLAKAVGERAHLEEAAAILIIDEDYPEWGIMDYRLAYLERLDKWREAERERKRGGHVVKSTP